MTQIQVSIVACSPGSITENMDQYSCLDSAVFAE